MEGIRKNVWAEGDWRIHNCCCCFDLKTGTTILGVFGIIVTLLLIIFPSMDPVLFAETDEKVYEHPQWITLTIIRAIAICTMGAMVYGNIKNITKLMIPHLYVDFIVIIISFLTTFPAAVWYIYQGQITQGLVVLFLYFFLRNSLSLYYWHVIRCRTLEIDEVDQPTVTSAIIYYQQDPEEPPAYGSSQVNRGVTGSTYEYPDGELPLKVNDRMD